MLDINYFSVVQTIDTLVFTPKDLIQDIIYDKTSVLIPFSNGNVYLVYQVITFNIMEALEEFKININIDLNEKYPRIIISNIKEKDYINVLNISSSIINNCINKKFSLI